MPEKFFMERALKLAHDAAAEGEVPVGCVIVRNGIIVAEGRNRREETQNALELTVDMYYRVGFSCSWVI